MVYKQKTFCDRYHSVFYEQHLYVYSHYEDIRARYYW